MTKLFGHARIEAIIKIMLEKGYKITEEGQVFNPKGRLIGDKPHCDGYKRVGMSINRENYSILTRQLIWTHFKGVVPVGYIIENKDGNRGNDSINNLALKTTSANASHAAKFITNRGKNSSVRKLNDELVTALRNEYREKPFSLTVRAREMKIAKSTIHFALNGKTYSHVPDPILKLTWNEVKPKPEKIIKPRVVKPKIEKIKEQRIISKIKANKLQIPIKKGEILRKVDAVNIPKKPLFDIKSMAAKILAKRN